MKKIFILLVGLSIAFSSCKREEDAPIEETDTTAPVVTLTSPTDSSIYHNGDTVLIAGLVTDNELHEGTILITDDTSSFEYYGYYPYVHGLTSSQLNYIYVVSGVSSNRAVTLSVSYADHTPNTGSVSRKLFFQP